MATTKATTNSSEETKTVASDDASGGRPPRTLQVAIGSSNPSKAKAVENALNKLIAAKDVNLTVTCFPVESNVPDQPFGDEETRQGAKNRAKAAYQAFRKERGTPPHISVGLEGGLEWVSVDDETSAKVLYAMGWMALYGRRQAFVVDAISSRETKAYHGDKKPVYGLAKTATFPVPTPIRKLIESGMELGDADDKVFDRVNSKQKSGTVGILTDGLISRSEYYEHAIILALTPWIRPDVYEEGSF